MGLAEDAYLCQVKTWHWLHHDGDEVLRSFSQLSDSQQDLYRNIDEMRVLYRTSLEASTFALDPDIADAVYAASLGVPDDTVLHPEDLPEPMGFTWSNRELRIPEWVMDGSGWGMDTIVVPSQGFTWMRMDNVWNRATGEKNLQGVMFLFLTQIEQMVRRYKMVYARNPGTAIVQYSLFWRFGDSLADMRERSERAQAELQLDDSWLTDEDALARVRYVMAFWRFIAQDILVRAKKWVARPAARRGKALAYPGEPVIDIVELRRKRYPANDDTPAELRQHHEWSCRWLVRGHWRNQWYPKENRHKLIWIEPYVKGPDDQPFKLTGHRVYKVVN